MKIDFYDLFTVYEDENGERPAKGFNKSAVKKLALQKAGCETAKAPKRRVRPFAAVAAGLAAATALTVTVGAVSGWDLDSAVRSWFGAKTENTAETVMDMLTDIEVLSLSNTFDNLDFEFLGAVTDDNMSALFVDITRNDGGILDLADYELPVSDSDETVTLRPYININSYRDTRGKYGKLSDRVRHGNEYHDVRTFVLDDADPTDSKITAVICFNTNSIKSPDNEETATIDLGVTGIDRTVCTSAFKTTDNGIVSGGFETEDFHGTLRARVALSLKPAEARVLKHETTVIMNTDYNQNGKGNYVKSAQFFTLKSLTLTSTAISFSLEGAADKGTDMSVLDLNGNLLTVNMKDGESFIVNSTQPHISSFYNNGYYTSDFVPEDPDVWYEKDTFMLGRVIDLSEVKSVEIGGKTIDL